MDFYWLCLLGVSLLLNVNGAPTSKEIMEVSIDCGSDEASNKPVLRILTDVAISPIAKCQGGDQFFQTTDNVHYILPSTFNSGDQLCRLNQREGSDTYAIEVMVQYGEVGSLILTKRKIVSVVCTFSSHGKDQSPEHVIINSPVAPIEMQHIIGSSIPSADLKLSIQTVDNKDAVGAINLDRMYSVFGNYTGSAANVGLKPVSCDAVSTGGNRYAVLRAGCGDGLIFSRTLGFRTRGTTFRSPYFEAFHLGSGEDLSFDCNVTLCTGGCDGSSCETICGNVDRFSISNGDLQACIGNNSLDDTCQFICDPGYNQIGNGVSTCGADGIWTRPVIKCIAKDCGPAANVTNASFSAPSTTYPNIVTYTCDSGYEKDTGSLTVGCLATGSWAVEPTCKAKDCGPAANVTNASFSAPSTTYPNIATYTCDSGYEKDTGSLTVECLATGSWAVEPTCKAKECGPAANVTNASFSASSTTYPNIATYTCDSGYEKDTGSLTVGCLATGSWDVEPTCKAKDCGPAATIPFGSVSAPSTTFPSVAIYTCNPGHERNTGSLRVECLATGSWDVEPTCQAKDCGPADTIPFASVSARFTTFPSNATYTCDSGYELGVGSLTVGCLATGSWDVQPTCRAKDCGPADTIPFASVSARFTTFPSNATYTCNSGYELDFGSLTVGCLATGSWDVQPTCQAKDCGPADKIPFGSVSAPSTTFPSNATYTCNPGHERNTGSLRVECLATGSWDVKPTCQAKDCGPALDIPFGSVSAPLTTYPYIATYTCDPGHETNTGSLSVGCLATGSWDVKPTCKAKDCGPAVKIPFGFVSAPITTFPSNATYTCYSGHEIIVRCLATGSWDVVPTCKVF